MENKVTLKELSKILNVSISTVSKALNDSSEISHETRQRVKELAKLNNYLPNAMAQNLKKKSTRTIGVIIPAILPQFFSKVLHGIETRANKLGYKVIVCISNESLEKEKDGILTLIKSQVDGLIISLARETQTKGSYDHFQMVSQYNIPLVLFDRVTDEINCDKVIIRDRDEARKATAALFRSGCNNVAYFSAISHTSVDNERKRGYELACKNLKKRIFTYTVETNEDFDKFFQLEFIKRSIDGILVADELTAILLMKTALKHGLQIPLDLSVIGFANGTMGEHFITSLSVVDQRAMDQGIQAVDLVVDRIEGKTKEHPVEVSLDATFIYRESTRLIFA